LELNQVVHDNQLAYLPFARSGRADAVLFDKYPELVERIERGKRARIDSIVLSNKYAEGNGPTSSSFRAQSLEELTVSPLRQRTRRRVSKEGRAEAESPRITPALKGKASIADLMFEMSDGEEEDETGARIRQPQFTKLALDQTISSTMGALEPVWAEIEKGDKLSPHSMGIAKSPILPTPSPLALRPAVERPLGRPWGSAPLAAAKLDLKDIMAQTPSNKPSNLSLGFSQQEVEENIAGSFHSKKSQKERKKQKQAQQLGNPTKIETPQPVPPTVSPWQAMSQRKPSISPAVTPSPQTSRAPSIPQLTMRQTIANKGAASKNKEQENPPQASRAVSGSGPSSSGRPPYSSERGMSVSTTPIPTPHSVRHIPLPSHSPLSPSQHLSMEEILSLQEAEKVSIRDAAAKRSLQEIQQEQEFQEWWDQESKRAIQEEEQKKRSDERTAKASRGRGKTRSGRGRGKGKDRKDDDEGAGRGKGSRDLSQTPAVAKEGPAPSSTPRQDGVGRGRGKPRGGRGVGRGGRPQTSAKDVAPSTAVTQQ
jgi:hypothetical protein